MALADPQAVTISGTAQSMPRVGQSLQEGRFASSDGNTILDVKHSNGKRNRHVVKLTSMAIVADPLVPSQNLPVSYSVHLVVDAPRQGVTALQQQKLAEALAGWASAANLAKLVGGES